MTLSVEARAAERGFTAFAMLTAADYHVRGYVRPTADLGGTFAMIDAETGEVNCWRGDLFDVAFCDGSAH